MKTIMIATALTIFVYSCSAWSASDVKQPHWTAATKSAATETASNLILFKVAGQLVKTSGWNISEFVRNSAGALGLNITTNMHEDCRTILVNLNGCTPGHYAFSEQHTLSDSYGDYKPDYTGDLFYSYSFVSGAFDITEVNTEKNYINATFSGTVKDKQGNTLEITEGKIINGTLTKLTKP